MHQLQYLPSPFGKLYSTVLDIHIFVFPFKKITFLLMTLQHQYICLGVDVSPWLPRCIMVQLLLTEQLTFFLSSSGITLFPIYKINPYVCFL